MKRLFYTLLCLTTVATAATISTKYIKSTYISDGAVAISCKNGGDPTGTKQGDILIISCGTR